MSTLVTFAARPANAKTTWLSPLPSTATDLPAILWSHLSSDECRASEGSRWHFFQIPRVSARCAQEADPASQRRRLASWKWTAMLTLTPWLSGAPPFGRRAFQYGYEHDAGRRPATQPAISGGVIAVTYRPRPSPDPR